MPSNKSGKRRKNVLTNECGQTIDVKSKQLLYYECEIEMVKQVAMKPKHSFSQNGANELYEKYVKKRHSTAVIYCLVDRLRFQKKGAIGRPFHKVLPYRQIKHFFVFPNSPSVFMMCVTDEDTGKRYYEMYRCRPEDVNVICDLTYKASIDPQNILRDTVAIRQISILSRDDERELTRSQEPSIEHDRQEYSPENNLKMASYFESYDRPFDDNAHQHTSPKYASVVAFNEIVEPVKPVYRRPQLQDHLISPKMPVHHRQSPTQTPVVIQCQSPRPRDRSQVPDYPRSITVTKPVYGNRYNYAHHTDEEVRELQDPCHCSVDSSSFTSESSYSKVSKQIPVVFQAYNPKQRQRNWSPMARADYAVCGTSWDRQSLVDETPPAYLQKPLGIEIPQKAASTHNLRWGDKVTYIQYDPKSGPKLTNDGPFYMYITRHESPHDISPHAVRNAKLGNIARSEPNLYY